MNDGKTISLRRLIYVAVAAMILYILAALIADLEGFSDHVGAVPWWVIAGACVLSLFNYGIRFARWHLYLRLIDISVPLRHSLLVFLAGLLMSISPAKIGEVLKSALLKRSRDLPIARTASVVIAERTTDLLGLFALAALGIIVFRFGVLYFVVSLVVLLAIIAAIQSPRLVSAMLDLWEGLPLLGRFRGDLERAYASTRTLLRPRPLAGATLLAIVSWSMEALAFLWLLNTLDASAPLLLEGIFIFSTSTLLGAASFLPGGLGVTEGSMTAMLLWLELFDEIGPALAATYLIRFTTLWFGVLVGFLSFLVYERLQMRHRPTKSGDNDATNAPPPH